MVLDLVKVLTPRIGANLVRLDLFELEPSENVGVVVFTVTDDLKY